MGTARRLGWGLGIWGGIACGTLAGLWVLRRRGADIPRFLDAAAPALLVAQAIGRIGNYFNQELFGGPTGLPWALQISPAHRPLGYEQFATFHPTFLYELIWNLALAAALVWLGRNRRIRAPGLFALYVAGYSLGRIGEELLRVDPAQHILGLRLNFYVAVILCLGGLAWFAQLQYGPFSGRRPWRRAALLVAGTALAFSGCGHSGQANAATALAESRGAVRTLDVVGHQRSMSMMGAVPRARSERQVRRALLSMQSSGLEIARLNRSH